MQPLQPAQAQALHGLSLRVEREKAALRLFAKALGFLEVGGIDDAATMLLPVWRSESGRLQRSRSTFDLRHPSESMKRQGKTRPTTGSGGSTTLRSPTIASNVIGTSWRRFVVATFKCARGDGTIR
jgi:hypothetical protein